MINCHLRSLYLCVEDMDRAIRFYEAFFEHPVAERDPVYSVFDIAGFRLGLFAYRVQGETHGLGSNCLPSVEVESLEMLKCKLEGKKVVFPITKIRGNWVSEFEDSESNRIELTAPIGAGEEAPRGD